MCVGHEQKISEEQALRQELQLKLMQSEQQLSQLKITIQQNGPDVVDSPQPDIKPSELANKPRIYMPVCLPACLSVFLPVCLPACLPACLSVCLTACMSVCLSDCLPACLPWLCIFLSVYYYVSVYLFSSVLPLMVQFFFHCFSSSSSL